MHSFLHHRPLRRPLIVSLGVTLISCLLLAITYSYMKTQEEIYLEAHNELKRSQKKLARAEESTALLEQYEAPYHNLIARNIVGNENRLDWIETLNRSSEAMSIPNIKYTIAERRQANSTHFTKSKVDPDIYRTDMTIEMELAHEGEMLDILENLQQNSKGLFLFERCETTRNTSNSINRRQGKGILRSSCTINWYTISGLDS